MKAIDTHTHWFPQEWVDLIEKKGAANGAKIGRNERGQVTFHVPGMGYVQAAAAQAQAMQQQKQATANQQAMAGMADNMSSIMPQMMRGQRVYELAQKQNCAFIQGPPPGAPVQ